MWSKCNCVGEREDKTASTSSLFKRAIWELAYSCIVVNKMKDGKTKNRDRKMERERKRGAIPLSLLNLKIGENANK
jgi:hypothetical protein